MTEEVGKTIATLDKAAAMTISRLQNFPQFGPYLHAASQIALIRGILQVKGVPTAQQKAKIDIVIMAIKELDSSDPDYAEALCELSFYFKRL